MEDGIGSVQICVICGKPLGYGFVSADKISAQRCALCAFHSACFAVKKMEDVKWKMELDPCKSVANHWAMGLFPQIRYPPSAVPSAPFTLRALRLKRWKM